VFENERHPRRPLSTHAGAEHRSQKEQRRVRSREDGPREELAEDYRRMIYAETRSLAEQAPARFAKKWRLPCPAVIERLDEAGDDRFAFLRFPKS